LRREVEVEGKERQLDEAIAELVYWPAKITYLSLQSGLG
jgi:hypothetical protein